MVAPELIGPPKRRLPELGSSAVLNLETQDAQNSESTVSSYSDMQESRHIREAVQSPLGSGTCCPLIPSGL